MVSTTQAVGYEGASLGLTLSGGCGPVSSGLEAGMECHSWERWPLDPALWLLTHPFLSFSTLMGLQV